MATKQQIPQSSLADFTRAVWTSSIVRAYDAYKRKDDDLERHIYLHALQDTDEEIFCSITKSSNHDA
jgi:hypothetical protein